MPIDKVTAPEWRDRIRTGITSRTLTHDTAFGPIRDIVIDPLAEVFETQNDDIRRLSLLVSLINSSEFTDEDLDEFVFNESITRITGSRASGSVTFSTQTIDRSGPDLVVPRGFPIGTLPDQSTGQTVTFVTTESGTLAVATATANPTTGRYELTVSVEAVTTGSAGRVGPGRISNPLRPTAFDEVSNASSTSGGLDSETNAELIERYLLSIVGVDLTTPFGIEKYIRDQYPDSEDALVVYGTDELLTRSGSDPGAVDAYVIGDALLTATESLSFLGFGQLIQLTNVPIREVTEVRQGGTVYQESVDYEVVLDETAGGQGSVRAVEGISFLAAAATPPTVGDVITIDYSYNGLIANIQSALEQRTTQGLGRDLLIREGVQLDVILTASIRVNAGITPATVTNAVRTALLDYINGLGLGDDVEESDLQAVVRGVSGVDNFIITRLVTDPAQTGAADILVGRNEFARLADADLTLNLI